MSNERRLEELNLWAESLGGPELDYLLGEAHREFSRFERQIAALDARFVAIVGWSLVGIGTLLIAGVSDFDLSAPGLAASLVIAGASVVVVAGAFALLPRSQAQGSDVSWFTKWEFQGTNAMKGRSLVALIYGMEVTRKGQLTRTIALQLAVLGLLLEFGALVAHLILVATAN